ncbi:MAG TPA: SGNH/GDSL hydrolase family protein [Jatrophihabitans sp.]|nr:SGNH/GDSL hydrolase family protein [Jatrophihabitans sp.]
MTMAWAATAALLLAGCGSSAPARSGRTARPSTTPSAASSAPAAQTSAAPASTSDGPWSVVALGDSIPSGYNCTCTPYPKLTAALLTGPVGRPVSTRDDAVAGYTTNDVIRQLTADQRVIGDVRAADLVEIQIGANDVSYSAACGTRVACYSDDVPQLDSNLRTIVRRVHALTSGLVVLLDYWSVWLGGRYAKARGEEYVDAAELVTDEVNTTIRIVAAHTGSAYVDLRAAFKGPDYRDDETGYLAADGMHPNAAGHRQIAAALVAVVTAHLHLP